MGALGQTHGGHCVRDKAEARGVRLVGDADGVGVDVDAVSDDSVEGGVLLVANEAGKTRVSVDERVSEKRVRER